MSSFWLCHSRAHLISTCHSRSLLERLQHSLTTSRLASIAMQHNIKLSVHRVYFAFSLDPQRKSVAGNNMPTSKMCLLLKLLEVFLPSRNLSTDLKSLNHTESLAFSSKQPTEEKRNCAMLLSSI